MRNFISACVVLLLIACNEPSNKSTVLGKNDSTSVTAFPPQSSLTYAYKPSYTVDFELGNPKYAQTVVQAWKDFDNNNFANSKDAFADSVAVEFSNGQMFNGTKDSLVKMAGKARSAYKTSISEVETFVTLKPKGKEETWVCVWGKEITEMPDGKKDSAYLNENWMFNKDGKVAYVSQLSARPHKK